MRIHGTKTHVRIPLEIHQLWPPFAKNCLEPFFRRKIQNDIEKITQFNDGVKDALGGKKAIRSSKPHNCPHCGVKASTIGDLRRHMKRCHTKPNIDTPRSKKATNT